MSRYPRNARSAQLKCIDCNAPLTYTVEGEYTCVECGSKPVSIQQEESEEKSVGAD